MAGCLPDPTVGARASLCSPHCPCAGCSSSPHARTGSEAPHPASLILLSAAPSHLQAHRLLAPFLKKKRKKTMETNLPESVLQLCPNHLPPQDATPLLMRMSPLTPSHSSLLMHSRQLHPTVTPGLQAASDLIGPRPQTVFSSCRCASPPPTSQALCWLAPFVHHSPGLVSLPAQPLAPHPLCELPPWASLPPVP